MGTGCSVLSAERRRCKNGLGENAKGIFQFQSRVLDVHLLLLVDGPGNNSECRKGPVNTCLHHARRLACHKNKHDESHSPQPNQHGSGR